MRALLQRPTYLSVLLLLVPHVSLVLTGCDMSSSNSENSSVLSQHRVAARRVVDKQPELIGSGKNQILLEHDFGIVIHNETVVHEFEVHNPTSSEWKLADISSSCACTGVEHDSDIIEAGGVGVYVVKFVMDTNTSGYAKTGVVLRFDGNPGSEVGLRISAEVRNPLEASPSQLQFEWTERQEVSDQLLRVRNYGTAEWSSVEVDSAAAWVKIGSVTSSTDLSGAKQCWVVPITLNLIELEGEAEYNSTVVNIVTDDEQQRLAIPVRVVKQEQVVCVPESIAIGRIGQQEAVEKRVFFRLRGNLKKCDPSSIKVQIDSEGDLHVANHRWKVLTPELYRLDLTLNANGHPTGTSVGERKLIVEFTSIESCPQVSLGVTYRITNGG